MPTAAGGQSRHQSHPNPTVPSAVPQEVSQSPQPPSWGWSVPQVSVLDLGQVWTYLRGTSAWEEAGSSQLLCAGEGPSACPLGLLGALPVCGCGAVGLMHAALGGLWLWGGCRESQRPFLCLQLLPAAGPGLAGDPRASGWAGSFGEERSGKALTEGALGGGSTFLGKTCALGLTCHVRAVLLQPDPRFAILSFVAVFLQKLSWAGSKHHGTWLIASPKVSLIPCLAVPSLDAGAGKQV